MLEEFMLDIFFNKVTQFEQTALVRKILIALENLKIEIHSRN